MHYKNIERGIVTIVKEQNSTEYVLKISLVLLSNS